MVKWRIKDRYKQRLLQRSFNRDSLKMEWERQNIIGIEMGNTAEVRSRTDKIMERKSLKGFPGYSRFPRRRLIDSNNFKMQGSRWCIKVFK